MKREKSSTWTKTISQSFRTTDHDRTVTDANQTSATKPSRHPPSTCQREDDERKSWQKHGERIREAVKLWLPPWPNERKKWNTTKAKSISPECQRNFNTRRSQQKLIKAQNTVFPVPQPPSIAQNLFNCLLFTEPIGRMLNVICYMLCLRLPAVMSECLSNSNYHLLNDGGWPVAQAGKNGCHYCIDNFNHVCIKYVLSLLSVSLVSVSLSPGNLGYGEYSMDGQKVGQSQ